MATQPPPASTVAMKTILRTTTQRLAALLGLAPTAPRASAARAEPFRCARRRHVPVPADASRIPAYLRRRRLPLAAAPRFDPQALERQREGLR